MRRIVASKLRKKIYKLRCLENTIAPQIWGEVCRGNVLHVAYSLPNRRILFLPRVPYPPQKMGGKRFWDFPPTPPKDGGKVSPHHPKRWGETPHPPPRPPPYLGGIRNYGYMMRYVPQLTRIACYGGRFAKFVVPLFGAPTFAPGCAPSSSSGMSSQKGTFCSRSKSENIVLY